MIVGVCRREAAIRLEGLTLLIAAAVAALAAEHRCRVGHQGLGGQALARTLKDLGKQTGGERELVALSRQSERLQFTQRQEAAASTNAATDSGRPMSPGIAEALTPIAARCATACATLEAASPAGSSNAC